MLIQFTKEFMLWAICLASGVVLAFIINHYVLVNAHVLTASMEGTIMAQSRVIGLRMGIINDNVNRGDIVVFNSPLPNELQYPFIKRVIALEGDKIEMTSGIVKINGIALAEPYLQNHSRLMGDFAQLVVPYGHVFVMGDNRNFSRDSREWGTIPRHKIFGRVFVNFNPLPIFH